jgi:pyrroline-5-carboxylate reductase
MERGIIMFDTVSFIGCGRVARIMLGGWKLSNALPPTILAFDANPVAVASLQADFPSVNAVNLEEAASADLVFGALHPPAMPEMLASIACQLKEHAVFCSLAPKVKLSVLQQSLGGFGRLARINPNAPSIIGQGFNPIAFASDLPVAVREQLFALLQPLGQSPEVDEHLLESYAVISAMGPTYFGFQFAEVEKLANSFGLDPEAARQAMRAMLMGTVDMLFASDLPKAQALDLVPVRPMAAHEAEIVQMLQKQLGGIYAKLTS